MYYAMHMQYNATHHYAMHMQVIAKDNCVQKDVWLNGCYIPYQNLNAILMTFKLIYQHQATLGITGLMCSK